MTLAQVKLRTTSTTPAGLPTPAPAPLGLTSSACVACCVCGVPVWLRVCACAYARAAATAAAAGAYCAWHARARATWQVRQSLCVLLLLTTPSVRPSSFAKRISLTKVERNPTAFHSATALKSVARRRACWAQRGNRPRNAVPAARREGSTRGRIFYTSMDSGRGVG